MADGIRLRDVQGTGIAIGSNNNATVTQSTQQQQELTSLIASLRELVQKADLPDNAKQAVLTGPVQQMASAAQTPNPAPQIQHGVERINDQLQVLGVTASRVEGIVGTVAKIANIAGVAMHTVPFLASLL